MTERKETLWFELDIVQDFQLLTLGIIFDVDGDYEDPSTKGGYYYRRSGLIAGIVTAHCWV